MSIVVSNQETSYQEYKKLILLRDDYLHKAYQYEQEYLRYFGSLIREIFVLKIECIAFKKKITYCQQKVNRNEVIQSSELEQYIEAVMSDYNEQLDQLTNTIDNAKSATVISDQEFKKIKHIYRKIAKLIHPDMNPKLYEKPEIKDLWERTVIAYNCNNLKELQEIEVLLSEFTLGENESLMIEDIEEKIIKLKQEIDEIKENNPYQYKFIIESIDLINEHIEELNQEKQEYIDYKKQLETMLNMFQIEKVMS